MPKLLAPALLALVVLLTPTASQAGFRTGFNTSTLAANDDLSTGANPLGFTVNFFGTNYSNAFVNNNGNLTFDSALGAFTPFPLGTTLGTPIIAAFFADVDTSGAGSGLTLYGQGTVDGRAAFGATWDGVGYYFQETDKLNSFQALLVDRSDTGAGNFDIEFNYTSIQWETGSADGGTNGLGGSPARVGYTAGTGAPGSFAELPGSGVPGSFLDGGSFALASNSLNSSVAGRYVFNVRNGAVVTAVATPAPAGLVVGILGASLLGLRRRFV